MDMDEWWFDIVSDGVTVDPIVLILVVFLFVMHILGQSVFEGMTSFVWFYRPLVGFQIGV